MNRNNGGLVMPNIDERFREVVVADESRTMIAGGGRIEEIVNKAVQSINDVQQASAMQLRGAFEQLNESIKHCEAKIAGSSKVQVIIKPDEVIISAETNVEVLKD